MLRAVVLTQYRRVTDGRTDRRTDGIAVANTALAMRALRCAVKALDQCVNQTIDRSLHAMGIGLRFDFLHDAGSWFRFCA